MHISIKVSVLRNEENVEIKNVGLVKSIAFNAVLSPSEYNSTSAQLVYIIKDIDGQMKLFAETVTRDKDGSILIQQEPVTSSVELQLFFKALNSFVNANGLR